MITQGADVLIIAAIDGTALSSQLQAAADAKIPVIAYDRLIRDSPNVDFYVSFDNFKVGVAQANALLAGLGSAEQGRHQGHRDRAVQRRAVRRLARRQQRALLLQRRDGDAQAVHRQRHAGGQVAARPTIEQVAILRWQQETAQKRMEDLLTSTYNDGSQGQRRPVAVRRPVPRHHHRAAERRLRHGGQPDPGRHRPGRGDRVGQAHQRRRAELDDLQGHPTAGRAGRHRGRGVPAGQAAGGQRHHDVRERRQGRPVVPAAGRDRLQGRHQGGADRLRLLHRRRGRGRSGEADRTGRAQATASPGPPSYAR